MDKQAFLDDYRSIDLKNQRLIPTSRAQLVVPKLTYQPSGRSTEVLNYEALCKFTNRSLQVLSYFFASRLGVRCETSEKKFLIGAFVKHDRLRQVENKFYSQQVLCDMCKSPETMRQDNWINCLSCQSKVKKKIKN